MFTVVELQMILELLLRRSHEERPVALIQRICKALRVYERAMQAVSERLELAKEEGPASVSLIEDLTAELEEIENTKINVA
jgi:hypothetical protein